MTQEEKAKAYDEALERARKLKENPQQVFYEYSPKEGETIADYIFPELKESEDERIRKELIDYHRSMAAQADDYVHEAWISWLEKQGEQKPQRMVSAEAKEALYDKPACAWSEEDEKMVANLVDYFKVDDALQYTEKQVVDWLKSLKQKIKGE